MHATILTLFPEMFPGLLAHSLAGKALHEGLFSIEAIDIRRFATDKYRTVDDTPYGGGAGMVLRPDIIGDAITHIPQEKRGRLIYLSPRGKRLTQPLVKALVQEKYLTLLCGRYEGIDERVLSEYNVEEVSIGDYILSGGEIAAMVLLDACVRLIPGVMGGEASHEEESFENGLLEYPHYTKPQTWRNRDVPPVLLSGHHEKIAAWRLAQAESITAARRPDLWQQYQLQLQRKERKK